MLPFIRLITIHTANYHSSVSVSFSWDVYRPQSIWGHGCWLKTFCILSRPRMRKLKNRPQVVHHQREWRGEDVSCAQKERTTNIDRPAANATNLFAKTIKWKFAKNARKQVNNLSISKSLIAKVFLFKVRSIHVFLININFFTKIF